MIRTKKCPGWNTTRCPSKSRLENPRGTQCARRLHKSEFHSYFKHIKGPHLPILNFCITYLIMSPSKILVLGGTGPAGLCLLRELLHRNHSVVAYARSPSKIPSSISSNPLLSIVKGDMDDLKTFSAALNGCSTVISHLGPNIKDTHIAPTMYPDMFRNTVIPAMRERGVKRLIITFALSYSLLLM